MNIQSEKTSLWADLRVLPRSYWILVAGTFINRFGTFVFPFLTLYLTSSGFSPGEAKLALAAHGLGHLLAAVAGGWLADRIGRRNSIALSMFAASITMICLSQANTLPTIILFAGLTGCSIAMYHPAASALLADLVPPEKRVRAYTVLRIAVNGGWAAGVGIGGWIAEHSFLWLFIGDALTCLVFGVIAISALPHGIRRLKASAPWSEAIASMRRNSAFVALFIANFCSALIFTQMSTTFALQVTDAGYSKQFFGALLALNGVLIVLFELPISGWSARLPTRPVLAVGYLIVGLGFALNLAGATATVMIASMVLFTLGEMLCLPVSGAYVASLAPEQMRGRYMGAFGLSWALATTVGPLGLDLYAFSPDLLWVGSAVVGLIAAGAILGMGRTSPSEAASKNGIDSPGRQVSI